jgi:hypothetical protein
VFPAKKGESTSIKYRKYSGPEFGIFELEAEHEPFNGNRACWSWTWGSGSTYNIGVDSHGRNLLTNQLSEDTGGGDKLCWFTITELEVWKVKLQ